MGDCLFRNFRVPVKQSVTFQNGTVQFNTCGYKDSPRDANNFSNILSPASLSDIIPVIPLVAELLIEPPSSYASCKSLLICFIEMLNYLRLFIQPPSLIDYPADSCNTNTEQSACVSCCAQACCFCAVLNYTTMTHFSHLVNA